MLRLQSLRLLLAPSATVDAVDADTAKQMQTATLSLSLNAQSAQSGQSSCKVVMAVVVLRWLLQWTVLQEEEEEDALQGKSAVHSQLFSSKDEEGATVK